VPIFYKIEFTPIAQDPKTDRIDLRWPVNGLRGALDAGKISTVAILSKLTPSAKGEISEIEKLTITLRSKPDSVKITEIEARRAREEEELKRNESNQSADYLLA